jgi:hypothetical protein
MTSDCRAGEGYVCGAAGTGFVCDLPMTADGGTP